MSGLTFPNVPVAPTAPKNVLAKSTVNILNIVRWIAVGVFGLAVVVGGILGLVGLVSNEPATVLISVAIVVPSAFLGALAFAVIGWFVDTLNLLTQIARNTHPAI